MKSRDPKKQITQLLKGVCVSTNIYTNISIGIFVGKILVK